MSTSTWHLIRNAIEAALDHGALSRFDAARRECANRPSVEAEVGRLVRALEFSVPSHTGPDGAARRPSETQTFQAGQILASRFRILRFLGMGGMGEVYETEDQALGIDIAVKTVRAGVRWSPQFERRFLREVELARRVTHQNVCRIHDLYHHAVADGETGTEVRIPFLTMELLRGETLAKYLSENPPLSPAQALPVLRHLTGALAAAHSEGVVHRDFKPGNVFLVPQDDGFRAVVTDFGLAGVARESDAAHIEAESSAYPLGGTPGYAAPEQMQNSAVTAAADIYGLGVVACEMVTGQLPSEESLERLPLRWRKAVARCCEPEPSRRFSSAHEFMAALDPDSEALGTAAQTTRRTVLGSAVVTTIGLAAAALWNVFRSPAPHIKSIAVLAFVDNRVAGQQSNSETLFSGLTGELIQTLLSSKRLRVAAPYSASKYKPPYNYEQIAAQLNTDAILTGILYAKSVVVRLVDNHGSTLWMKSFSRERRSDIDVHRSIRASVVTQLAQMGPDFPAGSPYEPNSEAYQAYLTGRFFWGRRKGNDVADAQRNFRIAIQHDPEYAAAWAGLADTLQFNGQMSEARDAARKALALDPNSADAHLAMGMVHQRADWNWTNAEMHFRKALDLEASNSRAHHWYAGFLSDMGKFAPSIREFEMAVQLDPVSVAINIAFGICLVYARHFDRAMSQLERAIALDADANRLYPFLGACWLYKGDHGRAQYYYKQAERHSPRDAVIGAHLVYCLSNIGQRREALAKMETLAAEPDAARHPFYIALAWAAIGERGRAFASLDRAVAEHDPEMTLVKVHPYCDSLRLEPEYQAIVKRMQLV